MFMVLLRFSDNKNQAAALMEGHNQWLQRGFDEGVFVLAGSLPPGLGGGLLAHNTTSEDLQRRVNEDPFVAENVVRADITEIAVARTDARLDFLKA